MSNDLNLDGNEDIPLHDEPPPPGGPRRPRREASDLNLNEVSEEDVKIQRLLQSEQADGSSLEIYRKANNGKWAYLDTLSISDWSDGGKAGVADNYGGGEYWARIRKAGGFFGQSFKFAIDGAAKPRKADIPAPVDPAQLMREAKQLFAGDQNGVMAMMQQMQQQSRQDMMAFMQMMQAQSAENTKMMIALMGQKAAPASSAADEIIKLVLPKLLDQKPAPALDLNAMLDAMKKLRDLTEQGGDDEDERPAKEKDDGVMSGIIKVLPSLLGLITRGQQPQALQLEHPAAQPAPSAQPSAASPAPAPAPSTPPVTELETMPLENLPGEIPSADSVNKAALAQFLPQVILMAEANWTGQAAADAITEVLSTDQLAGIMELLDRPDWLAVLIDCHKPVEKWTNWFVALRTALLEDGEETVAPVTASTPANP